jgi:hypothetical protein
MKHLKLFEGWSDEYLFDFTDDGKFDIKEDGKKVVGEYRGEFDTATMTNQFADSVFKMSSNYKILKAQSFFNQVTGNAKFEIEVQDYDGEFIEIDTPSGKVKWYPEKFIAIYDNRSSREIFFCNYTYIEGRLENGTKKTLEIRFLKKDNYIPRSIGDIEIMRVSIGNKYRGVLIDKPNISKLLKIISENKITTTNTNISSYLNIEKALQVLIEALNLFA